MKHFVFVTVSVALAAVGCHAHVTTGTTSTSSSGAGGKPPTCKAANAAGIELADASAIDATTSLGYPPYAIDGCELVYLAPGPTPGATGELRVRDLASGSERVLAPSTEKPTRPAISGTLTAWEANENGVRVVRSLDVARPGASPATITGPFDHAGEPRVASGAVVFTAWLGAADTSDTDVYLYDAASGNVVAVATGPGQQRFADISSTHVAWSDFSKGQSGIFADQMGDASNVVVIERSSGLLTTRSKPGKQAFPMLGVDGKVAYLDWGTVHPEPKFSEYDLRIGEVNGSFDTDLLVAHIQTNVYLRPVAKGSAIDWIGSQGQPTLMRFDAVLAGPPTAVFTFPAGEAVAGPTADPSITLIGAMTPNMPPRIQAFAR